MYQIELAIENVLQFEKNKTGVGAIAMLDENKKIIKFAAKPNFDYDKIYHAARKNSNSLEEAEETFNVIVEVNDLKAEDHKIMSMVKPKMRF